MIAALLLAAVAQPQLVLTADPSHRLVEGVASDGKTIWLSSVLDRSILECRTRCRTLATLPEGLHPFGIAWDADRKRLWVAADCPPKVPGIAAYCHRHRNDQPFVLPAADLGYTGNFLNMLFKTTEARYKPHPVLERALDVLFILHADHEQNCSTSAMRNIGSSQVDPYSALAGASAALYGPLHGGANEAVLRMLNEIGSKDKIPAFIKQVKAGEGRLMGP